LRSIQLQVPTAGVERVLALANAHGARSPAAVTAQLVGGETGAGAAWSVVFVNVPNVRVGPFIAEVAESVHEARFVLLPVGSLPLGAPLERMDERVRDVSRLSTLELVTASLQSVGAWRGLLLYSVLAGVVGSYGLIFDAGYLLVAAMLINPMGAPALVSVVGLAIGDAGIFARGSARFAASLGVQASTALAFGYGYGLAASTPMMEQVTSLSMWAVVVAMAAGAAGAQAQVQSERDSLVSGTAAGFMVAAALAPPAAVLGLAVPLGRWDYLGLMAFLLALQYLAIGVGGWLVLHGFGVRPAEVSVGPGTARVRNLLVGGIGAALIGLVVWQTQSEPGFSKADLSRTALEIGRDAVGAVEGVAYLDGTAHFTRPELERYEGEVLLFEVLVEDTGGRDAALVEAEIRDGVRRLVEARMTQVVAFVRVVVLPGPPERPQP